jgi:hypothetical protein
MPKEKMVTVWMRIDPEYDRKEILRRFDMGMNSIWYAPKWGQERLAEQGYRIRPRDLKRLEQLRAKFESEWKDLVSTMTIEHVGAPKGAVPSPEVVAAMEKLPPGQCLVEDPEETPVTTESRSRH